MYEAAFRDLRKLADWFSTSAHESLGPGLERLLRRLGSTAIPLLCRELCGGDIRRRDAARDALEAVAAHDPGARARVSAELHAITEGAAPDDAKVVALGLLSELGEHADARFSDPSAIRVRSAIALASHLETAADLASAADLMVHQLEADDIERMLEVMTGAAPDAAHRLASELALRLDVSAELRDRVALVAASTAPDAASAQRGPDENDESDGSEESEDSEDSERSERPQGSDARDSRGRTRVDAAVLVDAAARLVVIASRWSTVERRWRRWAVLIGASGRIEDCLHEDDAGPHGDTAGLSAALCGDGYRVASRDLGHARAVVAAAARFTAESTGALPSPYYLGRDLLGLRDAHVDRGERGARPDPAAAALARATELVAAARTPDDHARAEALLAHCDPGDPDAAAALAASLLAQGRPAAALTALGRAIAAEPDWPLHHWNLAVAMHQLGDDRGSYHALQRFVATSASPTGLLGDPDQPGRLACARRMIAELERSAWLAGRPLRSPTAPHTRRHPRKKRS